MREEAEKRAGTKIVLRSIADAEDIQVSEEEIEKELEEMSKMYGMDVDEIKTALEGSMDYFRNDIRVKKTIDMLFENADITMVEPKEPIPAEEVEAPAEAEEAETPAEATEAAEE